MNLTTIAILYVLLLALAQGLAMVAPANSKAARLARHARNALFAFIPMLAERFRRK